MSNFLEEWLADPEERRQLEIMRNILIDMCGDSSFLVNSKTSPIIDKDGKPVFVVKSES